MPYTISITLSDDQVAALRRFAQTKTRTITEGAATKVEPIFKTDQELLAHIVSEALAPFVQKQVITEIEAQIAELQQRKQAAAKEGVGVEVTT
jgi:hypothetical protein